MIGDTKLVKDIAIIEGCNRERCAYTSRQAEAFYHLITAEKVSSLLELSDEAAAQFYETQNLESRKRAQELFPKIQEELKRVVAQMGLAPDVQEAVMQKIGGVHLSTDCLGEGYDPRSFAWSSILEDGSRQITICDGMLFGNSSDFSLVFSLAHEISHQIDPCFIHFGPQNFHYQYDPAAKSLADYEKQNPFYDGIRCLRDPKKSIGAVTTMNFSDPYFLDHLDMKSDPMKKSTPFCDSDRLPEAFADAMGAKVLASYFQNKSNVGDKQFTKEQWRAGLLNTSMSFAQPSTDCVRNRMYQQSVTDEYPSTHFRLNGLLMANSEIRRLAGCENKSSFAQCL
jgi:hypothetical protein